MYGVETLSENNSTVLETPEIIIWVPFPLSIDNALLLPSPYQSGYQYHWLPANSVSNFATPPACGTLDYYVRAKTPLVPYHPCILFPRHLEYVLADPLKEIIKT